jgi:Na+-transporting methylmalonyl-CoA/oxaloacetate decarboxylase beta subunit
MVFSLFSQIYLFKNHQYSCRMKHSLTEGLIILSLVILFWGIGLRMTSDNFLATGNKLIVAGIILFAINYYRRFIKKD